MDESLSSSSKLQPTQTVKKRSRTGKGAAQRKLMRWRLRRNQYVDNLIQYFASCATFESLHRLRQYRLSLVSHTHFPLLHSEMIAMRYGHLIFTHSTPFHVYLKSGVVSTVSKQEIQFSLLQRDIERSRSKFSLNPVTDKPYGCTCASPSYWLSELSCGCHRLQDCDFYYSGGERVCRGLLPEVLEQLHSLDSGCESDGDSEVHQDIPPCDDDPIECDVPSTVVQPYRDDIAQAWVSHVNTCTPKPFCGVLNCGEHVPYVVYIAPSVTLNPRCSCSLSHSSRSFRIVKDYEAFNQSPSCNKIAIVSELPRLSKPEALYLVVNCPVDIVHMPLSLEDSS